MFIDTPFKIWIKALQLILIILSKIIEYLLANVAAEGIVDWLGSVDELGASDVIVFCEEVGLEFR